MFKIFFWNNLLLPLNFVKILEFDWCVGYHWRKSKNINTEMEIIVPPPAKVLIKPTNKPETINKAIVERKLILLIDYFQFLQSVKHCFFAELFRK